MNKARVRKEKKRKKLEEKYHKERMGLRNIIKSEQSSQEMKMKAQFKLQALPRDSSRIRQTNRCSITGRSGGYIRDFGISRIVFRRLAHRGVLPGVLKSSW